jgi:ribosomal protein S18 acetylase RimI-like enzyme
MLDGLIDFKKKRMRSFFLSIGNATKTNDAIVDKEEYLTRVGLAYIQMRLPIEKITEEFENRLKEEINRGILRAKIREAKEADLVSVMNIYNKAWMTSNEPFAPMRIESLKKIFNIPEITIFIANVYGNDAGFIILDFEGDNKEYGVIAGLGIMPRFQRKGLGKILGMAAWNFFKQKGVIELRCEVHVDNKASYNFIKSLGFEESGTKVYKKEDFHLSND